MPIQFRTSRDSKDTLSHSRNSTQVVINEIFQQVASLFDAVVALNGTSF